ncbi:putative Gly-X carboxypeptidase [Cylindrobasidium torrendii FP15055 ss-10]|uniref:Putative Gly-X carboxypeptidase n=1 Tax=Cylindrobasidium torrendii FP15055 ss-10 TaxID=1314674 RepID=A0A0D7BE97_9AGAR|nr:putative Gly-X carboxypeptidase [Cylindrobasidium torrendii FP15055 ss-10]
MRGLPLEEPSQSRSYRAYYALLALGLLGVVGLHQFRTTPGIAHSRDFQGLPVTCPAQADILVPSLEFPELETKEYRDYAAERLAGAVRIPTETFDSGPKNGSDPYYDKFSKFEAYLRAQFPHTFSSVRAEVHGGHGILLFWEGSDESLEPIILMAHQDTVPVPLDTVPRWTHPPFSGHYDEDGWVWGRGAGDCKGLLIAELAAVEKLVISGFEPARTVILSFGFDEEGGGVRSAAYLSARVEELYGPDSILLIVDEGEGFIDDEFGRTFIRPGFGEKGSTNIAVTVAVPGGHSSVPPEHTGIGILSSFVTTLEANPFQPILSAKNPYSAYAQCLAEFAPDFDSDIRDALSHERTWGKAAKLIDSKDAQDGARLKTTQAVDIISGGVKVNALPEQATAIVNHRVSVDSSVAEIRERYISLLTPEAKKFNLTVVGFEEEAPPGVERYLKLSSPYGKGASPVSPYNGAGWEVFGGTARHVIGEDAIVAPFLMNGGTDTRVFQNLTRNIYRFQPLKPSERAEIHTVDEHVHIDGHLRTIKWIHALVQNADTYRS